MKASNVWEKGSWNLAKLFTNITEVVVDAIHLVRPMMVEDMSNVWVWGKEISGTYTTKSAYKGP